MIKIEDPYAELITSKIKIWKKEISILNQKLNLAQQEVERVQTSGILTHSPDYENRLYFEISLLSEQIFELRFKIKETFKILST